MPIYSEGDLLVYFWTERETKDEKENCFPISNQRKKSSNALADCELEHLRVWESEKCRLTESRTFRSPY